MFTSYTGIDEAALGPTLGPYCCTAVTFEKQDETELFDHFSQFTQLKIGDSKKLFKPGKGLVELEKTALSFLSALNGRTPGTLEELLKTLIIDPQVPEELKAIPWYENIGSMSLPIDCERESLESSADELDRFLESKNIAVKAISSDVVSAWRFNGYLKNYNKSESCQQILTPLISGALKDKSRIIVDRQGGRRYYGEWLINLFPGSPLSIRRETQDLSVYDLGTASIHFQVKGDDLYLETALASIFSKYLRELMMESFNAYWREKVPDIKKTAGYPQDARRFIRDLKSQEIKFSDEKLIRKK